MLDSPDWAGIYIKNAGAWIQFHAPASVFYLRIRGGLNDVWLYYLFAALEPLVVHDRRVERGLFAVKER